MTSTVRTTGGTTEGRGLRGVAVIGLLLIVFGAILAVAGVVTWVTVANQLSAENITVSKDAAQFAGATVDTPWEAYAQAEVIQKHALEASGGKTYAELDQTDPKRTTVMTASFLRASLFTSVVAFGVALMAAALGVGFILVGFALRRVARRADVV
ncbi:aromatic ring-opening dioxygenase LigA [Intrasporangium flavum]|uniref:aromatic ring-opening dioxygenase LigA n=1 Tax=Intrasporangium flavum TaxID=1428657 RepID=UPI00096D14FE|nr:aromatic ring-opening dioxygenase LigA [Intrasporangium flavum]